MAEDWAIDVRKYAPDADDAVIAGIVRHCGIALRNRDSSLVSFTDPAETGRVRDGYCRKKLGLTETDAEVDAAIARVGERMRGDNTKNRVTVYYLLAAEFGKLGLFGAAKATAARARAARPAETAGPVMAAPVMAAAPIAAPAMPETTPAPVMAAATAAPVMAAATTAPVTAHAAPAHTAPAHAAPARPREGRDDGMISTALIGCGAMGAIILVAATIGSLALGEKTPALPADGPPIFATAPAPAAPAAVPVAAPAIPEGSGVIAQDVAGKPQVSVYFATGKSAVSPDFATAAAPVKAWLDGHAGSRLAVSGFNDASGNAAANAELSKNRAKSVAAALTALGVPAASIDLEKPPETTDTGAAPSQARRVDIVVKDAG